MLMQPVIDRLAIANALTALVSLGLFRNEPARRVIAWDQVAAQPAIFVRKLGEHHQRKQDYRLRQVTLEFELWIYVNSQGLDPDQAGSDALDLIMGTPASPGLETVFMTPDDPQRGTLTLGGLVQHCWIEGTVHYDNGDIDNQAKMTVPVLVLCP